jgi:hypothetical protein
MGPIQTALMSRLREGSRVDTASRRGTVQYLRRDSLGVLLRVGAKGRVVSIPWPAVEGLLSLLQSRAWTRIGPWPLYVPRQPVTLSDFMSRWTSYRQSALWAAALLESARIIDLDRGKKVVRIRVGRAHAIPRRGRRLRSWPPRRRKRLLPSRISIARIRLRTPVEGHADLGSLARGSGPPSWEDIRSLGHDLVRMRDASSNW